ncbi:MAG: MBL fold metallo-hydrolase [Defluviitaleaceae bacterium]|nr:MBL fold metallo-hydrolase [Defluviitaleaceae bacterium]
MKKQIFLLCILAFLAGCGASDEIFDKQYQEQYYENIPPDEETATEYILEARRRESGMLEVHVFGIASADAILITTENYVVLIDTGERQHGRSIAEQLFERGIFHVDYLIITHFDRDHVGGAYDIIRFLNVRNIIVPNYRRYSNSAERFREAKARAEIEAYVITEALSFTLDDAVFGIYPSALDFFVFGNEEDEAYDAYTGEEIIAPRENDFSIFVSVVHGENSFLFTGDAMAGRLGEFLADYARPFDFLKLPHHGRYNRLTEEFLNIVRPRYAVSTCCFDRPIDERVVSILDEIGTEIFLSINGGVSARSDGTGIVFLQ